MKRLFAAIRTVPDPGFINDLRAFRRVLHIHSIKWVEEENLHVTAVFLGETDEEQIPSISRVLGFVSASTGSFSFCYHGIGVFGSRYNPKVIWSAVRPYEACTEFIRMLKKELEPIGFPSDRQNTVPHLTLGRVRSLKDRQHFKETLDRFNNISSLPMVVDHLILFESVLGPSGPTYHEIGSFPLK